MRLLARRWTDWSFQSLSGPSPPSPSCFSSPCSSSRRRSRSWSMTQKNLKDIVTRARSSKLKRRSPQQDREWRTILRANHSFRISRVPGGESCQKVDPGCPKVLKPFIAIYRAVSDQCTTKELTLFYNFFGYIPCLSYTIYVVVRLWYFIELQ